MVNLTSLKETPLCEARIETLSHDGRGIARVHGKATFIDGALPGELVTFIYTNKKKKFDEGKLVKILSASPFRREPVCAHYAQCGGCSLQHMDVFQQIAMKQANLLETLKRIGQCKPEKLLPSLSGAPLAYRHKARFSLSVSRKNQNLILGFKKKEQPSQVLAIQQCPNLAERGNKILELLPFLLSKLQHAEGISSIEMSIGDTQMALILCLKQTLTAIDREKLCDFAEKNQLNMLLQESRKPSEWIYSSSSHLSYTLPLENLRFHFHPQDFIQVNPAMNALMVQEAVKQMALTSNDRVLDLFCGVGNFSLAFARHCQTVVGVEGSEQAVVQAKQNAQQNELRNATFHCADLFTRAAILKLSKASFTHVFLDPPRAGAFEVVKHMNLFNAKRIVYVSCDPATLARDAQILIHQHGFHLSNVGMIDMFPQTPHIESIAVFERTKNG